MRATDGMAVAAAAHAHAERGDYRAIPAALEALGSSPAEWCWAAALRAAYAFVTGERAFFPNADALARAASTPEAEEPACLAFRHLELDAVLRFDGPALARLAAGHAEIARSSPRARVGATAARAWASLFAGDAAALDHALGELATSPAAAISPEIAVERSTLRALAALERGELEEATRMARRASRAARTDGLLGQEYLANLVLARVRRRSGRAHLALRIASALRSVAPRTWRPWLEWETSLAGGQTAASERSTEPLAELFEAAALGERERYERARETLRASVACAYVARELGALEALLDRRAPVSLDTAEFCAGRTPASPFGIRDPREDTSGAAVVLASADSPARRCLPSALGLHAAMHGGARAAAVDAEGRAHTLLSALLLAGPDGLSREDLFQSVYGFGFVPVRHDGVFRSTLHRARQLLGSLGSVEHTEQRLVARLYGSFAVVDPRCERSVEERVLRAVGEAGERATVQEISQRLRISSRLVQRHLKGLVDEGVCIAARQGNRVEYRIEDTTFYEPSIHRLRPVVGELP